MPIISNIRTSVENQQALVLDPHAKKGAFCRDARGRLLSFSGGFTVVYPYEVNSEKWAFRCWHTEMGNVRRRFEIIARAIQKTNAKYLCDFAYVDEGIIVDGKVYPTTRMRWVEGSKIKDYICSNKANKVLLEQLAKNFLAMVQDMHSHHLAHGDLQHGNIIVDTSGNLFLVDYDSFYCDELSGEPDIITGLKDYQHPLRRTNKITSEKIDYFSELIIYLSILGIAAKPELVEKYQVEDSEHMLFEADDFEHLHSSKIYQELHGLSFDIDMLLIILDKYLAASSLSDLRPFDIELDKLTKSPEIKSFNCSSKTCLKGDKIIISWQAENFSQILLNGKDVTSFNSLVEIANAQTEYRLEVINYQKQTSQTRRLKILPRPTISFKATKKKLHAGKGENVTLSWNVNNADNCTLIYPDGTSNECKNKDSIIVIPTETSTYTLHIIALDKKTFIDTPITIKVCPDAEVQFTSDKEYVFPSIPFTLSWQVKNAKQVKLNGKDVKETDTLTHTDGVKKNTTYTLCVLDEFGTKDYPLTIKILPIPQIKTILVPTPHINEKINISATIPIPKIDINCPQPDIHEVDLLDMSKFEVHVETNSVPMPELITPNFGIKEPSFWQRAYNKLINILKYNGK